MKIDFELTVDEKGNPYISFRHYDKSNELEQKLLKIFIKKSREEGLYIFNPSGYIDSEGNSWENYQIKFNK